MKRTIHRPECRRYMQWKLERAKKSKQAEKKEKKDKPKLKKLKKGLDCVDDDNEAQPVKVSHRKCKKVRSRKKRPKKTKLYVLKHISLTELALKKIKPSMEVRELLLNPRHTLCLNPTVPELDMAIIECAKCLLKQRLGKCRRRRKRRRKRTKKMAKGGKSKREEEETKDVVAKKSKTYEDSEADECKSICSIDSQICLAGVKLTAEDKKKLKQRQREVEDANAEEKSVAAD